MTALQRAKEQNKKLKSDLKKLSEHYETVNAVLKTTDSELASVMRSLSISNKRTNRKEKVLTNILQLSDGMMFASEMGNKVVMDTLIKEVRAFAKSEITVLEEKKDTEAHY